jgi:hypothetical protein
MNYRRLLGLLASLLLLASTSTRLEVSPAAAEPELDTAEPPDGTVLEAPPESVRLCFREPVKVEQDQWRFEMRAGTQPLGLRIVFGTDGSCVDVFPGSDDDTPEGIWSLDWLVHAQSDGSEGSGVVRLQVGDLQPGQTPLPEPREPPQRSEENGDDGTPTALFVLAGVGVAIVVLAVVGFTVRRVRRRAGR